MSNTGAKCVVFESVYSMDGDIAPVKEIVALCKKYNAISYNTNHTSYGTRRLDKFICKTEIIRFCTQ